MATEEYRCTACGHTTTAKEYEVGRYFLSDCGECEDREIFTKDEWPDYDIPVGEGLTWEKLKEVEFCDEDDAEALPKPINVFTKGGEVNWPKIKGSMKAWARENDFLGRGGENPLELKGQYGKWLSDMNKKFRDNFFLFMRGAAPEDRGRSKMKELYRNDAEFRENIQSKWVPLAKGWWYNVKISEFGNKRAFKLACKYGIKGNDEDPKEYSTEGWEEEAGIVTEDEMSAEEKTSESHQMYPLIKVGVIEDGMEVNKAKLRGVALAFARDVDEILGTKPGFNIRDVRTAFLAWGQDKFGMECWVNFTMHVLDHGELHETVDTVYNNNDEFNRLVHDKYTYDPDRISGNGDNGATDDEYQVPESMREWAEKEGVIDKDERTISKPKKKGLDSYSSDGEGTGVAEGEKVRGSSERGPQEGTTSGEGGEKETVVIDLYCGAGGVGYALNDMGIKHVGVDINDYSDTYPGAFVQGDASDLEWLRAKFATILEECYVIVWLSPPCKPYSRASHIQHDNPREVHPTFDDLNVYEVARNLGDDFIIENVVGCDDFQTKKPLEINGWGVGKGFNWKRRFHTSFRVKNQVAKRGSQDMAKIEEQGENALAEAKGVPTEWGKEEKRSAIPPAYVKHILSHHDNLDVEPPETIDDNDFGKIGAWSKVEQPTSEDGGSNEDKKKSGKTGLGDFESSGDDKEGGSEKDNRQVVSGNGKSPQQGKGESSEKKKGKKSKGGSGGLSKWADEYGTADEIERPDDDVETHVVIQGDSKEVMKGMRANIADLVITSPPYWAARDYEGDVDADWEDGEWAGQLGHEPEPDMFVEHLMEVMRAAKRILKPTGCLFVNIDDVYGGIPGGYTENYDGDIIGSSGNRPDLDVGDSVPDGCLAGVPERFALAMVDDGWFLRNKIHWVKQIVYEDDTAKGAVKPDAAKDRFNEKATEYMYFFTPQRHYQFDLDLVRRPHMTDPKGNEGFYNPEGANLPNAWQINPANDNSEHVAAFPDKLVERPIKAACPKGGIVVDPFAGTGTVGRVAEEHGREPILIEMSDKYVEIARSNLSGTKQASLY